MVACIPKEWQPLAGGRAKRAPPDMQSFLDLDPGGIAAKRYDPSGINSHRNFSVMSLRLSPANCFDPFGIRLLNVTQTSHMRKRVDQL